MLKTARRILALLFLLGLTWLFLDFTGTAAGLVGWMARLQFLPALLAVNVGVVVLLVVVTLLVGRIYCSVICPLGILQDVISWIAGKLQLDKTRRRFGRFHYLGGRGLDILRYTLFALFVVCLLAGVGTFVQLLAPYSSFGRMVTMLLRPLYELGNNHLAARSAEAGTFDFYELDLWTRSLPVLIVAAVTFVVVALMAWFGGRFYCNNLCPVGTLLGFLSRRSILGVRIDADRCRGCRLCERGCKGSAIFIPTREQRAEGLKPSVDLSRCVDCFDCLDTCSHGALTFGKAAPAPAGPATSGSVSCDAVAGNKTTPAAASGVEGASLSEAQHDAQPAPAEGPSRRSFLLATATVLATSALEAAEKTTDGGIITLADKQRPQRQTPICPPGSVSLRHLQQRCTGCQLCVSACPNGVLRPSNDLMHMMVPESSYERGYCRPECTRCSDVCPAGAIVKFPGSAEERRAVKASTKVGTARWVKENCVVLQDGVSCGLCSRRCPLGAITMVPTEPDNEQSPLIPSVDAERCIGCGACENLCPARPFSAIYVEGVDVQREI